MAPVDNVCVAATFWLMADLFSSEEFHRLFLSTSVKLAVGTPR